MWRVAGWCSDLTEVRGAGGQSIFGDKGPGEESWRRSRLNWEEDPEWHDTSASQSEVRVVFLCTQHLVLARVETLGGQAWDLCAFVGPAMPAGRRAEGRAEGWSVGPGAEPSVFALLTEQR